MRRTYRLAKVLRLLGRAGYAHLMHDKRRFSEVLYQGLSGLGGLYVKFLQLLALRSDFFERWKATKYLPGIYEDVAIEPLDIHRLLESELGDKHREIELAGAEPFTAGSFGQVYRARLADGTDVIVKALRPSLVRYLRFDLALIGLVVRVADWLKPNGMLNLKTLFADFKATTLGETNYRHEAAAGVKLWERYRNHPKLFIPRTYPELSTKRILVQEYVDGVSAAELSELGSEDRTPKQIVRETLGSDLEKQLETLGFEIFQSAFLRHMNQGDPHPGNVKFLSNDRVALIDFGIVAEPPADRSVLLDLMKEYRKFYDGAFDPYTFSVTTLRFYAADLVAAINTLDTFPDRSEQARQIMEELGVIAERSFRSSKISAAAEQLLAKGWLVTTFTEIVNRGNRFGLRIRTDAPNFVRSTQMLGVLAENLGCKNTVFPVVLERVIETVEADPQLIGSEEETLDINRAMEILAAWLDRISAKDPILFRKLHHHIKEPAHA